MTEAKTHYATTQASDDTYRVFYGEALILESNRVIELNEHYAGKDYAAVIYFPASAFSALETVQTDKSTHCPIKGDASYWSYRDSVNGIWCYQEPLPQVRQIKNHYAFDQTRGFRVSVVAWVTSMRIASHR
ncbi:MAG: DUF427 domain-containing protein [Gammaproteobacteria bacterium]|nr:DUF427 domain-containing protein [Gammaproteobacteria bacterium]MDH3538084.1 DUF427 domain-containing protein [Gammaproteobacteria bacterium]